MASLNRTIARNIARERMIAAGARHIHRRYRINDKDSLRRSKAYRHIDQSLFGQLWRKVLAQKPTTRALRKPRETRSRLKASKGGATE